VVQRQLENTGMSLVEQESFCELLEGAYKKSFPPIGEESLAGSLSNTIAGRICNYFDLKGGGYCVDGACASSLLAVINACTMLQAGDIEMAIVGGVDLSLDPFELVGFAKSKALAVSNMRVFDQQSEGFWPGEGCGFLVLMRHDKAMEEGRRIHSVIRGWGMSSDGSGGITRPEVDGQILALTRAYVRAGMTIGAVPYFEGHGTGTSVGDTTEIKAIIQARHQCGGEIFPAAIGSVKANIGHTKAAAGLAGMIKAVMALANQIIPPTTGSEVPHSEFVNSNGTLRTISEAMTWPIGAPLRAGVSAMGFGGINTHIVLEHVGVERVSSSQIPIALQLNADQDAELFLVSADDVAELQLAIERLIDHAEILSIGDLPDLAHALATGSPMKRLRIAIVASSPEDLSEKLQHVRNAIPNYLSGDLSVSEDIFIGICKKNPRIGLLFPGHGSTIYPDGGYLQKRFGNICDTRLSVGRRHHYSEGTTTHAQLSIVSSSLAGLTLLKEFGVIGEGALGHSLGELTAIHWAGGCDRQTFLKVVESRGRCMSEILNNNVGAMASIAASRKEVQEFLSNEEVVIAGVNGISQTVISGLTDSVETVIARTRAHGIPAYRLPVNHAFHSPLVAAAVPKFKTTLNSMRFEPLQKCVASTCTGAILSADTDIVSHLCNQITSPVLFLDALTTLAADMDLLIEVGSGNVLTNLVRGSMNVFSVSLDVGGTSIKGLLRALGATIVLGAPTTLAPLFERRGVRKFDLDSKPTFLANPCELAPLTKNSALLFRSGTEGAQLALEREGTEIQERLVGETIRESHQILNDEEGICELIVRLISEKTEFPIGSLANTQRMLSDLHLNSITVSEIIGRAMSILGLKHIAPPLEFANASIAEIVGALHELQRTSTERNWDPIIVPGVGPWLRTFTMDHVPQLIQSSNHRRVGGGQWKILGDSSLISVRELKAHFAPDAGQGVVLCLPPSAGQESIPLLLESIKMIGADDLFVLVQSLGGATSFAKTVHVEAGIPVIVVNVPYLSHPSLSKWVTAEVEACLGGFIESWYDDTGTRCVSILKEFVEAKALAAPLIVRDDVLLVSGGGKGIGCECAIQLARETGASLILLGRSFPETDEELKTNLQRIARTGIEYQYRVADVTNNDAVLAAVQDAECQLGRRTTAILHGAGSNSPQLLSNLTEELIRDTLLPKTIGLKNLLEATDESNLKLLVTFGSIIAETGMRGEAHYALANEWLSRQTREWGNSHSSCQCLCVEWSIWGEVGMGERLGRVQSLMREGISPITVEQGTKTLTRLISLDRSPPTPIVAGRIGSPTTISFEKHELPLLRFLENIVVFYPGIEIITESQISPATDRYLDDHVFDGMRIFPGVMGLEAMFQVASVLLGGHPGQIHFEDVFFDRPILVSDSEIRTIRIAALAGGLDVVNVVIRSDESSFQIDHFRATIRRKPSKEQFYNGDISPLFASFDIDSELYGKILFQSGRFQRVQAYRTLRAKECFSDVRSDENQVWFNEFHPHSLLLGDPGSRDATLHCIQACVPHETLLPIEIASLEILEQRSTEHYVHALERSHQNNIFEYDIVVVNNTRAISEIWKGVRLKSIGSELHQTSWIPALLLPYCERILSEVFPDSGLELRIEVQDERLNTSEESSIDHLFGLRVNHRLDGKPYFLDDSSVSLSIARSEGLLVAIKAEMESGCDVQQIRRRDQEIWRAMLGEANYALAGTLSNETQEDISSSATRIWCAIESLSKCGLPVNSPLSFRGIRDPGWIILNIHSSSVATLVANIEKIGKISLAFCIQRVAGV
jgi:enediyne polyketide synthase